MKTLFQSSDKTIFLVLTLSLFLTACGGGGKTANEVVRANAKIQSDIQALEEILDDATIPDTTEAQYNKSEYAKNTLSMDERKESERAHILVATAKDPDPEWFSTKIEPEVIFAKAGGKYTLDLKKVRSDGSIIGAVDNDKLDIVVRVQRGANDYQQVSDVNINAYASWDGAGKINIHVPDSLENGRLLVAVRPNFVDETTKAIAQRWSALMSAEVWTVKDGTKTIEKESVLFPLETLPHLKAESTFTQNDIKISVQAKLAEDLLTLPLIVKDVALEKDDLVTYLHQGKPYAGRVIEVQVQDNQTFVLLAPEYTKIYDVVDIDATSAVDQGLTPKHTIYRVGDRIQIDVDKKIGPIGFKKRSQNTARRRGSTDLFDMSCSRGTGMLTFEPKFTVYPLDIGADFTFSAISTEVTCKLEATPMRITLRPPLAAGGIGGIIGRLLGSGFTMSSFGEEFISADALPSISVKVGWSLSKGASHQISSPVGAFNLGSIDLDDRASRGTLKAGTSLGIKYNLNVISADGWLGSIYSWFDSDVDFDNIGIEATVGPQGTFVVEAANAKAVEEGSGSSIGMNFGISAKVKFSQTVDTLIKGLAGIDSLLNINETYTLLDLKGDLEFDYSSVKDDGEGSAQVVGLEPKRGFIASLLPDSNGVLNLANSSVYNQQSHKITYDVDECNDKIVSPAIGCAGWMCGKVSKSIELCKADVCPSEHQLVYSLATSHPSGSIAYNGNRIYLMKSCQNAKAVTTLESHNLGSFKNKPNEYSTYYSTVNKPPNGYTSYDFYSGSKYNGLRERYMYASDTSDEFLTKVRNNIGQCQRWPSNYSGGNLNRNDNFWTYFCPKQSFVTTLSSLLDE